MNAPDTRMPQSRRVSVVSAFPSIPQFFCGASVLVLMFLNVLPALGATQISPPPHVNDTTAIAQAVVVDSMSALFLIQEGDEFAEKEFDNQRALARYLDALTVEPNSDEIFWRISRAYVDIAEHLPSVTENDRTYQLATYERAMEYANKAIGADPGSSMGYARRAVATSRIAMFSGVWESSELINRVREDAQRAIELDPRNSLAHFMLGRTHERTSERPWMFRVVLGLAWADLEEAAVHYEEAIRLRPDFISYRISCARAYFELGEYEKAKAHLSVIPSLLKLDEDDDRFKQEAKDLVERIREEEE